MRTRNPLRPAAMRRAALCAFPLLGCVSVMPSSGAPAPRVGADSIAIGYGNTTRERSTVAVGSVTAEDLDMMRVSRIEELLQGRVAGAEVVRTASGEYSIRIRGTASLMARGVGTEPLFVLDGMPMMQGRPLGSILIGVSPYDVARIDVLKDAGATASYGARGANGVVLITTRRTLPARQP
jgi:TonB-dependent SusC/RagA subfamily outer membrane receptor